MPLNLSNMGVVYAPWTDAEVVILNAWQDTVFMHPFMCVHSHRRGGKLVAENDGWHCNRCRYTQVWAHDFQIDETVLNQTRVATQQIIGQRTNGPES